MTSTIKNHEFIISKSYVERMHKESLRAKIVNHIQEAGPQISVKKYSDRFPYMLVLVEDTIQEEKEVAQSSQLALWGKGEVEDNYSVFVQTRSPELVNWGEEVFEWVSTRATTDISSV